MEKGSNSFLDAIKSQLNGRRVFAILVSLIVVISVLTIWNAAALQAALNTTTLVYVSDVTLQLSSDIDYRLSKNIMDLEMLRDSLIRMDAYESVSEVKEFLDQKTQSLEFSSLAVISKDGKSYYTTPLGHDIAPMPGVQSSFQGANGVSFLDQQSILYSIPIYRGTEVDAVLVGVRSKENMQELIEPKSFSSLGLTCITDCYGNVIISPTDLEAFMQLDDIFVKNTHSGVVSEIRQMQENMLNHQGGTFSFTAVDGTDLVLSYAPLNSYNWVLLTLVPTDLISHETNRYILQTFIIIGGIILLFLIILFVFLKMYRIHYNQLERFALVDRVTGAMNNAAFQLKCGQLLRSAAPHSHAVVLLNIKNFKLINENFGIVEGDNTLRHVMRVLKANITEGELVARADADNFFLCLRENEPDAIRLRLKKIGDDINAFNQVLTEPYHLIMQQGVYIVDDPSVEITIVQDRAKTACRNWIESEDTSCVFYDSAFTRQLQREHVLNDLFESSLRNSDFQVFLQPKIWLETGEIGGAEALIRWHHPQLGPIFPSDFISLFEKSGKICALDLYVFEEVCKTLQRWKDAGLELFPISVNLSRQHFRNPDFLLQFKQIATKYQIPKNLIELELTESIFFDDQGIEHVKSQIDQMHQMGFHCSLDDFGAGYSSLGLLMEFDVDVIKLDRRFFVDVTKAKTRDVVAAIVSLSKNIGVNTAAEGIETSAQLDFLRKVHCDMVQGYIFSKPLSIPEFETWWEHWDPGTVKQIET